MLDTLYQFATYAVRIKSPDVAAKETNLTADTTEEVRQVITKAFAAQELVQKLDPEQPIATFEYTLREFSKDSVINSSNRTVVVTTECRAYLVRNPEIISGERETLSTPQNVFLYKILPIAKGFVVDLQGFHDGENITFTSPLFDSKVYPLDGYAAERIFIPPVEDSCGSLCSRICRFLTRE